MRKLFLIIALLVLVTGVKSQSYTPFPQDTAVWDIKYYNVPGGPYTIYD